MTYTEADLIRDIERISQIPIIPTLLDVVCQTTGMGFAAVARVTQDRWIACSVLDHIQFGLTPGGELEVATTICNEIRDSHQPVIIDYVKEDDLYCHHHTPLQYGFQSYVSFPIILKNGDFFGTLCAIDPQPAQLNNSKIRGLFSLFSELISFHLQQVDLLKKSQDLNQSLTLQLTGSLDENQQYRNISSHHLQEPLRKLGLFSEMLIDANRQKNYERTSELATKISANAQKVSGMIKGLISFPGLGQQSFEDGVDLTKLITDVIAHLEPQSKAVNAQIEVSELPSIAGIPLQLKQLFYQLLSNALKFYKKETAPIITISSQLLDPAGLSDLSLAGGASAYVEILVEDNGIGIEASQLSKIFGIFSQLQTDKITEGRGLGLAYCHKIVRNHSGIIKAHSDVGQGTTISIILPYRPR